MSLFFVTGVELLRLALVALMHRGSLFLVPVVHGLLVFLPGCVFAFVATMHIKMLLDVPVLRFLPLLPLSGSNIIVG